MKRGSFVYKNHICNGRYCENCKLNVNKTHQCFILTNEQKEGQKRKKKDEYKKGYIFSTTNA